ncbi:hypothetical protein KR018_000050 [Drosophila ironensis]|nr:hypothetical protein KR018_000050 [Drosophila ironensis]
MSEDTYQIETRRRSRSKTPFLREEGGKKKPSAAPNVQTIVEEHVVASSSSKKTRSKAFAPLTSDYSSDDLTPDAKRKASSKITTTTVTSFISTRSGGATSTPLGRAQLETTQNTLNTAQEKLNHSNGDLSSGNVSDYLAYLEYRDAGEYWNKTPKTDYTYSELSPHRRQLAPGIVAMPNMSRKSLGNHDERINRMVQNNPSQEEFIRRRYQSKYTENLNYDSADEYDSALRDTAKQSWWFVRLIQLIVTSVSTVWTRITSVSSSSKADAYYARRQASQQSGLLGKVSQSVGSAFASLYRYVYLFIGSVLSLDTWLLQSSNPENKAKKRFLILLLLLLPLLLLTGWSLLQEDQRAGYVQRAEALLLPLPLAAYASLQGRLSGAGGALKSWFELPTWRDPQPEAEAIKLNMASIEKNIQKALTAEEYENILNHVNSYMQQLVDLKLQQHSEKQQQLSPQQMQIIVQLMKENLQQFTSKAQFNEQDISDLAAKIKLELQRSGEWPAEFKLSSGNLEEITRLIKAEITQHHSHYTINLEQIDFGALLTRFLGAPELADFVDARINLRAHELSIKREPSSSPAEEQIEKLNREIAFIKLALSDKQAENADLQQSISSLRLNQEDLLERMQQHELSQEQRFSALLAEINAKLAALNDSQFALLNKQVKLSLVEILGFKQGAAGGADGQLDDVDLQNWVRSIFVAKDYLEQQLLELNKRTNNNIRDEIERSSILLMSDISERLKREMLLVVEAKHNESARELKGHIREEEVRQIVKTVLAIYDADKTGLVDFALESAGGQILSTRCTESYQTKSAQISVFGIPLWYPTNTPRVAISPNVQPGECWAFQGFPGFLKTLLTISFPKTVLKLNSLVYVTGFTLEHIPRSLSPTGRIDSAPRNFTVWGLEHEKDHEPVLFGEYEYLDNGASLQYFAIQNIDIKRPYDIVELRIETNHGQPNYTCLYRFRVHGKPPAT